MESLKIEFKQDIENRCQEVSNSAKYNFFELIHQPCGFEALQTWFCSQGGSEVDEYGLFKILKLACNGVTETMTWEMFDTFAQDMTISFREFLVIIYLFAASESGQLKFFLYLHGKKVFQLIAGGDRQDINFERLKRLGRVLKMNENYLSDKGKDLSINYLKSALNYEQFEVFYFKVFADLDKQIPSLEVVKPQEEQKVEEVEPRVSEVVSRPIKEIAHHVPKKKVRCVGCHSKACNLL
jgi:hypothetical protein